MFWMDYIFQNNVCFQLVGSLHCEFFVSDGRLELKISDYYYLKKMPKEAWAWEFTRRNSAYVNAWRKQKNHSLKQKEITILEMKTACKFGLLAFNNPNVNSKNIDVFWSPNSTPNILKCSLIDHSHSECKEGLILADLDLRLTYVQSEDQKSHLLLQDETSSLQLVFDVSLDLDTFFDFEIHLPAIYNRSKQIKSAIKLDQLLSCKKFKNIQGLSDSKSNHYIEVLFAMDLSSIGYSQRDIAKIIFGEHAILYGWEGVSDSTKSKVKRLFSSGRSLIKAGHKTFFGV